MDPRTWSLGLLALYCLLIVLASLAGGWLPAVIRLTHTRMQVVLSFVGGLMLGIGLFHMLPHAAHETGSLDLAVQWMMVGLVTMFFLIRAFHFHQHEPVELPSRAGHVVKSPAEQAAGPGNHSAEDPHAHGSPPHVHHSAGGHRLSWLGIAVGLSLHTLIDGVALAASIEATGNATPPALLGAGTFLAILLHKPLDSVSITSLMALGGWPARWRNAVNVGFALMCPLGATLVVLGVERFPGHQSAVVGCALAFAAGTFVCISLGDLLPEMAFHSHNRLPLSLALLIGIALAWSIGLLEPDHLHSRPPGERMEHRAPDEPEHAH